MKTLIALFLLFTSTTVFATGDPVLLNPAPESENSLEFFVERQFMGSVGDEGYFVRLLRFEAKADPHVWYLFEVTSVYPDQNCTFSLYETLISEHSAYVSQIRQMDENTFELDYTTYLGTETYTYEYEFSLETKTCNHNITAYDTRQLQVPFQ